MPQDFQLETKSKRPDDCQQAGVQLSSQDYSVLFSAHFEPGGNDSTATAQSFRVFSRSIRSSTSQPGTPANN